MGAFGAWHSAHTHTPLLSVIVVRESTLAVHLSRRKGWQGLSDRPWGSLARVLSAVHLLQPEFKASGLRTDRIPTRPVLYGTKEGGEGF